MSLINQFKLYSEYNKLMNQRLFDSSAQLSEEELTNDRLAFFKSVLGTLNHIMVGDIIWLKRFSAHPSSQHTLSYISQLDQPNSLSEILFADFPGLKKERQKIDEVIIQWVNGLSEADIADYILYKNMAGNSFKKRYSSLISHFFLHQVHHRGQVTTLLSQSGIDFGDTDLIEIIEDYIT